MNVWRYQDRPNNGSGTIHELAGLYDWCIDSRPHLDQPNVIIRIPSTAADSIKNHTHKKQPQTTIIRNQACGECQRRNQYHNS